MIFHNFVRAVVSFSTQISKMSMRGKKYNFFLMPERNHAYSFFNLFLLSEGSLNMSALLPETPYLKFTLLHAFILGSCPTSHKRSIVGNRKNGCSIKAMQCVLFMLERYIRIMNWLGWDTKKVLCWCLSMHRNPICKFIVCWICYWIVNGLVTCL